MEAPDEEHGRRMMSPTAAIAGNDWHAERGREGGRERVYVKSKFSLMMDH